MLPFLPRSAGRIRRSIPTFLHPRIGAGVLLLAGVISCADDGTAGEAAAEPHLETGEQVVVTGRVIVTSEDTVKGVQLYVEGGPPIRIVGSLDQEISRLAGASLTVVGQPAGRTAVRATSYAALEINGEKPQVGIVVRRGTSYLLEREIGAVMLLADEPAALERLVGAKIWVTGPVESHQIRIEAYGVLRLP